MEQLPEEVTLDFSGVHTREEAHSLLAEVLRFPESYGRNLDALWDLLTTRHEPLSLTLLCPEALDALPDGYGRRLLDTLREAAEENTHIRLLLPQE